MALSGKNNIETAKAVGVSRRTLSRWLNSDEFKNIFNETYDNTINSLQVLLLAGFTIALKCKLHLAIQGDREAIDYFAKGAMNSLTHKNIIFNDNIKAAPPPKERTLDEVLKELDNHLRYMTDREIDEIIKNCDERLNQNLESETPNIT